MEWTGGETYADLAARREQLQRLCSIVGLDPAETTNVSVDVEPKGVVVFWEGARRLHGHEATALIQAIVDGFPEAKP